MFGRKAQKEIDEKPMPRVSVSGAFGKLESEPDFIQLDSSWREVKALDEILQGLYLSLSRIQVEASFRGCGLLLTGGADRQGLVALAYPSEDKAGRVYPFVLFNRLADAGFYYKPDGLFSSSLGSLKGLMRKDSVAEILPNQDAISVLSELAEHQPYMDFRAAKRSGMAEIESLNLEDWLSGLVGSDVHLRQELMAGTVSLIRRLKQGRIHKSFNGIWLPLAQNERAEVSVIFWLQLLSTVMATSQWRPDIVWTTHIDNARLFVLTKPLTASALEATMTNDSVLKNYLGWSVALNEDVAGDKVRSQVASWLTRTETNLLDVAIEWYQII